MGVFRYRTKALRGMFCDWRIMLVSTLQLSSRVLSRLLGIYLVGFSLRYLYRDRLIVGKWILSKGSSLDAEALLFSCSALRLPGESWRTFYVETDLFWLGMRKLFLVDPHPLKVFCWLCLIDWKVDVRLAAIQARASSALLGNYFANIL